jgi:hypothetical protein
VKTLISKTETEQIEACRRCKNMLSMKEGRHVEVECSAIDRFDCPYLLKIFYPKIYRLSEQERSELVARIRAGKVTAENGKYFS